MRALLSAIAALALVAAAPAPRPPFKPKKIVIAVDVEENVTITADGMPITCEQLNAYFASFSKPPPKPDAFDCKRLGGKHKP
jgi:hypothetical protein